jgi:hypothetical protein
MWAASLATIKTQVEVYLNYQYVHSYLAFAIADNDQGIGGASQRSARDGRDRCYGGAAGIEGPDFGTSWADGQC